MSIFDYLIGNNEKTNSYDLTTGLLGNDLSVDGMPKINPQPTQIPLKEKSILDMVTGGAEDFYDSGSRSVNYISDLNQKAGDAIVDFGGDAYEGILGPLVDNWYGNLSEDAEGEIQQYDEEQGVLKPLLFNFKTSFANEFKGLLDASLSPAQTSDAIASVISGAVQHSLPDDMSWNEDSKKMASQIADVYADRYGSIEGFKKALSEDPVPVLLELAGAGLISKAVAARTLVSMKKIDMGEAVEKFSDKALETASLGTIKDGGRMEMFAGGSAKYPPKGKEQMLDAYKGRSEFEVTRGFEDDIWKTTGWGKTPDGKSYFEIDDSQAYIKNEFELDDFVKAEQQLLKEADGSYIGGSGERLAVNSMENTLNHPELFRQYPVLKDYTVEWLDGIESKDGFVTNWQGQGGSFNPITKTITVHIDPKKGVTKDAMDTLLHEGQHGVQSLENWMNGGSTSQNFIRSLRWRLYDDQKAFATDKAKYDRQLIQLRYASKLDDVKYWDKMARKDSITGQARNIYGTSLWYKYSDDIRREIGIPPKRHKKAEHNEFLKDVAIFFKRKAQDEVNSAYNRSPGLAADVSKMTQKDKVGAIRRLMDKNIDNVDEFRRLQRGIDEMASPVDRKDAVRMTDVQWRKERGDLYKRIQGEWMARNTSRRYLMSKEKRRAESPMSTGDVDRQGLIYTRNPDKMYGEVSNSEIDGGLLGQTTDLKPIKPKSLALEREDAGLGMEQLANDDIALVGGTRSGNSRGDESRLKYIVYDMKAITKNDDMANANDYILGDVELFVEDGTGKIRGLVELNIKDKKKGTGRKVIDSLMKSDFVNDDFKIHSIKKSSVPFWKKMGVEFERENIKGSYVGDGVIRKTSTKADDGLLSQTTDYKGSHTAPSADPEKNGLLD